MKARRKAESRQKRTVFGNQREKEPDLDSQTAQIEIRSVSGNNGSCDGCGKKDYPRERLAKVDSGDLLCPDCINELKEELF